MSPITREDLKTLYQEQAGNCVSIYMPTYPMATQTDQGRILLKNLLSEAEKQLLAAGLRVPEAQQLLAPAQEFVWDKLFWRHQNEGLALFLATDTFYHYRLPYNFEPQAVVADRFHIKPLLPLMSDDGQFFILALSQNQVRLLQGTRYSITEVNLADIPANLAETLVDDGPERQLQFHTKSRASGTGSGKQTAIFHGHGAEGKESRPNIQRYFRQINKGVSAWLVNEHAPLILAGVEYLLPIYKEVNSYPHLMEEAITGNPEMLRAEELQERSLAIVQPLFRQARQKAESQYQQLLGSANEKASNDPGQIIQAAFHGRIEILFVALGQRLWGQVDPESSHVDLHEEKGSGDSDLLNIAVIQSMLNGGAIYAVPREEMPDNAILAAVFRY